MNLAAAALTPVLHRADEAPLALRPTPSSPPSPFESPVRAAESKDKNIIEEKKLHDMGHQSIDSLKITIPLDHQLRCQFRLGDLTWVKMDDSSWWPAQVVDEESVAIKPTKNQKTDCLVRLYGTNDHVYVDPSECSSEFERMLNQENKTREEFQRILEQDVSQIKSADQSKDTCIGITGAAAAKTPTNEQKRQKSTDRSRARPSAGANYGKSKIIHLREKYDTRNQVSRQMKLDTNGRRPTESENAQSEPTIVRLGKQGTPNTHNAVKIARTGTSITKNMKKEGVRRSIRIKLNEQVTDEDSDEVSLRKTSTESEKADQGNTIHKQGDGTLRAHNQKTDGSKVKDGHIRAMIRDILFEGKISELGEAEGPDAEPKMNGAAVVADAKQMGSRKRKSTESSRNKEIAAKEGGQRSDRQVRVMQSLALIAPSGSPYRRNGLGGNTY